MPNDCTAPPMWVHTMNSLRAISWIQYQMAAYPKQKPKPAAKIRIAAKQQNAAKQKIRDVLPPGVKLTKEGMDWLVLATDPFHDLKREVAGYPDSDSINSVVRCIQNTVDITAPGAVNWDAHIFTLPITQTNEWCYGSNVNGKFTPTGVGVPALSLGMVNVFTGTSGQVLFKPDGTIPTYTFPSKNVTDASQYQSRVIGLGLEVINTTAEVYKQGTVTAYRCPNRAQSGSLYYDDEKVLDAVKEQRGVMPCLNISPPPSMASEALLLRNSLQWEAKEGAYMPVALNSVDNPFQKERFQGVQMTSVSNMAAPTAGVQTVINDDVTGIPYPRYQKECAITTSGLFFTGLSPQTTLTLRIKLYLEIAPSTAASSQRELANLANPSAPYDPEALVAYSRLMQILPVATKSDNNANGDWFKAVLKTLRKFVRPGLQLLDRALPGTVQGFDSANSWIDKWVVDPASRAFPQIP